MPARTRARVRLYHQVRTAHLERAAQLPTAKILFANKRYDFDEELAANLDLVPVRGWRAAWWLLRNPVETLEINEPLMLVAARSTSIALIGLGLSRLCGRARTRVVTYAIENRHPDAAPARGARHRMGRRLDLVLARLIWRRVDRIAYGTAAAQTVYEASLPRAHAPESTLIWALPAAAPAQESKATDCALFLGAFSERKGLPLVLEAWPKVVAAASDAALQIVGKGSLQPLAERCAATDASITLLIDPPRAEILRSLARAQVLILPSQPTGTWREQVGLPIVEGLSYGCTIVTTTETGLADWLATHGHRVVDAEAGADELADAILSALSEPLDRNDVVADLPVEDGRLTADGWLFR